MIKIYFRALAFITMTCLWWTASAFALDIKGIEFFEFEYFDGIDQVGGAPSSSNVDDGDSAAVARWGVPNDGSPGFANFLTYNSKGFDVSPSPVGDGVQPSSGGGIASVDFMNGIQDGGSGIQAVTLKLKKKDMVLGTFTPVGGLPMDVFLSFPETLVPLGIFNKPNSLPFPDDLDFIRLGGTELVEKTAEESTKNGVITAKFKCELASNTNIDPCALDGTFTFTPVGIVLLSSGLSSASASNAIAANVPIINILAEDFAFLSASDNAFIRPVVPEPSTLLLFGTGVLGIIAWGYRNKKKNLPS